MSVRWPEMRRNISACSRKDPVKLVNPNVLAPDTKPGARHDKLQQELQAEVTSGKISSTDQAALASALTDIDSSLQASRSTDGSSKPPHGDFKSKIDDLIAGEVSSGKLTDDQASALKDVFKAAFAGGPGGEGSLEDVLERAGLIV
eukprot:gene32206-42993_t